MNKCIKCGSYAFNLHKDNIDQGSLCDVHYWQGRAHRAEAQRTWVGLTDEETETLIHRFDGDPHTLLDEVNARLKEKNT